MWVRVCPVAQLPVGQAMEFRGIGIFHTEEGWFAIDNQCPHFDAQLHLGDIHEGKVYCPWHQWRFHLKTGQCDLGSRFDIAAFPVMEKDGYLWVAPEEGRRLEREAEDDDDGFVF